MKPLAIVDKLLEDEEDYDPKALLRRSVVIPDLRSLYQKLRQEGYRVTEPWSERGGLFDRPDYEEEEPDTGPEIAVLDAPHEGRLSHQSVMISVEPDSAAGRIGVDVVLRNLSGDYHSMPFYHFNLPSRRLLPFLSVLRQAIETCDNWPDVDERLLPWKTHK